MTEQAGKPQKTIEDALAQRVEARRDGAFAGTEALHEPGALDRAVYEAVVRPRPRRWTVLSGGSLTPPTIRACGLASPP